MLNTKVTDIHIDLDAETIKSDLKTATGKKQNCAYSPFIKKIEQTEDTHLLRNTYTRVKTHLRILAE